MKSLKKVRSLFKGDKRRLSVTIFVLLAALVGAFLIVRSLASTPHISIEPENATKSGTVSCPDTNASGGSFLKFGAILCSGSGSLGITNKSRLGVDINDLPAGITLDKAYDTIASLGFGWVRTGPGISNYSDLNPNNFDYELSQAQRTKTKVMIVMSYAYGGIGCNSGHCVPNDPAAWAHYAGQLVAHWKTQYPGVVGAVEVWNEANNPTFWNPVSPAAYTNLLKRTYLEIKAVDSKMPVIASGTSPGSGNQDADNTTNPNNPATFYKQMYAAGAKGFFDAAANHPYDTKNLTANTTLSGLRNTFWIRKVMDANGEQAKQIWSTEAGLTSCLAGPSGDSMTEEQRASRLAADLQDFWHGTHDQTDGHTINTTAPISDWNPGPYFVFKLYKSTTGNAGLGIIYNTHSVMQASDNNDPQCKNSPDYYEPGSVSGKPGMTATLKFISASKQ